MVMGLLCIYRKALGSIASINLLSRYGAQFKMILVIIDQLQISYVVKNGDLILQILLQLRSDNFLNTITDATSL